MSRRPFQRRHARGGTDAPTRALLNVASASFSRNSRATIVTPTAPIVYAINAMRRRANGSIVIEAYRINAAGSAGSRSFVAGDGWSGPTSGLTYTAGVLDGPDGASLTADRVEVTGGGASYGPNRTIGGAGYTHMSAWVRAYSGSGSAQILTGYTGVYAATRAALTETWQRITAVGTGSAAAGFASVGDPRAIGGGTTDAIDAVVDMVSVGRERYPASDTLDGQRFADTLTWAASEVPLQLREGRSLWRVHPCHASAQLSASDSRVIFSCGGADDRLELYNDAGTIKARVLAGAAVVCASSAIAWAADLAATSTPLSIVLDAAAGSMVIAGASSGNGTHTGTPWTWPGGVSARLGGVYGAASEFDGSIYLPERV